MRKILVGLFVFTGLVFAQDPSSASASAPAQSSASAPVQVQTSDLPEPVRVLILEQEVAALRAELDHVHKEDFEWARQWISFLYSEVVRLKGTNAVPQRREGESKI